MGLCAGVTAIEPEWLPIFAPTLCTLSAPLTDPPPRYNIVTGTLYCHVSATFGKIIFVDYFMVHVHVLLY